MLAGGLVLGVAAARFLKASSRDRYQQRRRAPRSAGPSTPATRDQSLAPAVPPTERPSGVITPGQAGAPVAPAVGP